MHVLFMAISNSPHGGLFVDMANLITVAEKKESQSL